ncbi:DUF1489 domain-containing protein [Microvirga sp. W0021]|uniref:DUF1489 domain-containing protein n=1 Tax=Hohaiivirga grylli TaxID=3133970 RepID=A0ABV0BJG2_9HYPH
MSLHLIKLCVGVESIQDLRDYIGANESLYKSRGMIYEQTHTTRMFPKKVDELLDGGSMYWVIKGQLCCRQKLLNLKQFTDSEGINRCRIFLDHEVIAVEPRPYRPFQGWRYLDPKDAPRDIGEGAKGIEEMPESLRRELSSLGLL